MPTDVSAGKNKRWRSVHWLPPAKINRRLYHHQAQEQGASTVCVTLSSLCINMAKLEVTTKGKVGQTKKINFQATPPPPASTGAKQHSHETNLG